MLESVKQLYQNNINSLNAIIEQKKALIEQEVVTQSAVLEQNVISAKCREIDESLVTLANALRANVEKQIQEKEVLAKQSKEKFRNEQIAQLRAQISAKYIEEIGQLTSEEQEIEKKLAK